MKKEIIHSAAGHYIDAHRDACAWYLDRLYKTSPNGRRTLSLFPRRLSQGHQRLSGSESAGQCQHKCDGGIIIWTRPAARDWAKHFEEWMGENHTPDEMCIRSKRPCGWAATRLRPFHWSSRTPG